MSDSYRQALPVRQAEVYGLLGTHPRSAARLAYLLDTSDNTVSSALRALAHKGLIRRGPLCSGGSGWRRA